MGQSRRWATARLAAIRAWLWPTHERYASHRLHRKGIAALKSDGSMVTLGDSSLGCDSSAVAASLTSNVVAIYFTNT